MKVYLSVQPQMADKLKGNRHTELFVPNERQRLRAPLKPLKSCDTVLDCSLNLLRAQSAECLGEQTLYAVRKVKNVMQQLVCLCFLLITAEDKTSGGL